MPLHVPTKPQNALLVPLGEKRKDRVLRKLAHKLRDQEYSGIFRSYHDDVKSIRMHTIQSC